MFIHRHRSHVFLTALFATTLSLSPMPVWNVAHAGSTNATIKISARIMARTSLKIIHQIRKIMITSADIQKGYIEIKDALHIEVKSNNPTGYMLTFQGITWPFREIHVQGLASEIQIGPGSNFVHQPYYRGAIAIELDCRLHLAEDTEPGIYAWPLSISSQPI